MLSARERGPNSHKYRFPRARNNSRPLKVSEPPGSLLYSLPLPLFGLAMLAMVAAAHWAGQLVRGRTQSADAEKQDGFAPAPPVVSSILGLLTLLISFTFSMAIGGYDKRYDAVIDEAHAIYATDLDARLAAPQTDGFRAMLKQYVAVRLAAATSTSARRTRELTRESSLTQQRLWEAADALRQASPTRTTNLLQTTESMIAVGMRRVALRQPVVPIRVLFGVILFTIVSSFVLGYSYRGVTHRTSGALLLLLTLVIVLIVDVEQPSSGAIRESQQPMQDARARLLAN